MAVCGSSPTTWRRSAPSRSAGSRSPIRTTPSRRRPVPCSAQSSEDLPEPLRPISAVTRPRPSARSSSRTATLRPWVTVMPLRGEGRAARPAARSRPGAMTASVRARRRASRTVSGSGSQPAARPSSTIGGTTGESASSSRGRADPHPAGAGEQAHPVGERHHPLEPVLGQQHRDPEVVHQPGERGQHVLGRRRVERRRRLVEHQQPRVHRQHRADRDPLLLAAGEGAQVAVAQRRRCRAGRGSPRPGGASSRPGRRAAPCRRRAPPRRCR